VLHAPASVVEGFKPHGLSCHVETGGKNGAAHPGSGRGSGRLRTDPTLINLCAQKTKHITAGWTPMIIVAHLDHPPTPAQWRQMPLSMHVLRSRSRLGL